jgi:DNA-binding MarR family transcriptional regulator
METKGRVFLREGGALLTRILLAYEIAEKQPVRIGGGIKLNAAQIHIIEAVGKGLGNTVTGLSRHFKVTKSAVSQIVSKLYRSGFLQKSRKKGNRKEILLSLTEKGRKAFMLHERLNESAFRRLDRMVGKYSDRELEVLLRMLKDAARFFDSGMSGRNPP